MELLFVLRAFFWIPLCLILWMAAIFAAAVWRRNKTMARTKKVICVLLSLTAVVNTYFMFIHGKALKAPVDPVECVNLYDDFAEKARAQGNPTAENHAFEPLTENVEIRLSYYESVPKDEPFFSESVDGWPVDSLYLQSFTQNGVDMQISALTACKETVGEVQVFNGHYYGSVRMRKGDTQILLEYLVNTAPRDKLTNSYTRTTPNGEISFAALAN